KDNNVWVKDLATGAEKRLSEDGTLGNYYSSYISWSPDGRKVASCKIRPAAEKRYVYYIESSPADQLQPKLHKQEYAKPGDELRFKVPCIFNVETGQAIIPSTELFANQYDLLQPEWTDDSQYIIFDYNERGHKVYRVLQLSVETGQVSTLIEETSDKYVNYPRYFRHNLSDNKRIIWMSERDNWNHLYMYDLSDLTHPQQITKGEWYVRRVIKVDEGRGLIYFTANGVDKDEDPYDIKYYRINFDGSGLTCLTPAPGHHSASFSPDMQYIVDIVSTPEMPPVATLRSANDGSELMHLETADISRLQANGWHAPEVFAAPGRDGKTLMWGLIQRPSNFDPTKKYPVIEYIYQGPGDQYVPKAFTPYNHWLTPLSELGFIVVMVDGMGTSFRSREFENICYKNLQDAGIPDHIAWIKAAAERYPELDIDRVGIYGCSAGGQESLNALLHYPEFYKACYSACGCHDNRMDKIWWNELWMGYPVDDSYAQASNVENAHLLQRPLMLVVGELDDNVDPASTMQVADALIKANKDFELVVIPGARHTMGESYGDHKRYDFFTRTLKAAVPPSWLAF
nr:S9 family peptidase [Muribaculaceae bacterium]